MVQSNLTRDLLADLNSEQIKAVTHRQGPLLIVAGAGTGKTQVITRRIAYLITAKLARPEEILALTFTEKAAQEMAERVDILVPYGFSNVWISTFHAFGDRIIRENAILLGLNPDLKVLSEAEATIFFQQHIFSLPLKHFRPLGNPYKYLQELLKVFSRAKDEDITPDDWLNYARKLKSRAKTAAEKENAEQQIELATIYQKYEELKRQNNFLDFADQVSIAKEMLKKHHSIRQKYQKQFRYILVDEFQDTNYAQLQLLRLLLNKQKNITVVGDDDQSIYKFRGACFSNIVNFLKIFPSARLITLVKNYRNTQIILDVARRLIKNNDPDRLETKYKIDKKLISTRTPSEQRLVRVFGYETGSDEVRQVVRMIEERIHQGIASEEIAILVRANETAKPFLEELNRKGIPWNFSGTESFYDRPEIKLILSFLRLLVNPEDSRSLYFILSIDRYQIKAYDLVLLNHTAHQHNRSLFSILKNHTQYPELNELAPETLKQINQLLNLFAELYPLVPVKNTGEVVWQLLKKIGIISELSRNPENPQQAQEILEKGQSIARFFRVIERFNSLKPKNLLTEFMEYLENILATGMEAEDYFFKPEGVQVLTVHKAKGLEFKVVFMVGLVNDRFPSRPQATKLTIPEKLSKDILARGDFHLAEERRLFYVGMTRARDELIFTFARNYFTRRPWKVSPFVCEALEISPDSIPLTPSGSIETIRHFQPEEKEFFRPVSPKEAELNLTPYKIDDYLTCPYKYYLLHQIQIPLPRHHSLTYGETIHKVLSEYLRAKINKKTLTLEELEKLYQQFWSSAGFLSRQHEELRYQQGLKTIIKYYQRSEKEKKIPVSIEESFSFRFSENVTISGRWDRRDEIKGKIIITDFKTTDKVKNQKDAEEEIRKNRQLLVYALGHKYKYSRPVDSVQLYFLEPEIVTSLSIDEKVIEKIQQHIQKVIDGIRQNNFSPNPNKIICQYCAYLNICPYAE